MIRFTAQTLGRPHISVLRSNNAMKIALGQDSYVILYLCEVLLKIEVLNGLRSMQVQRTFSSTMNKNCIITFSFGN